ncbi:hypothetical protein D3C71_1456200 [compost metagenome]
MALYSSQSTEGTSPATPAKRASAISAAWLAAANDSGASGGLAGGSECGTNALTGSPSVVDVMKVPVLRIV